MQALREAFRLEGGAREAHPGFDGDGVEAVAVQELHINAHEALTQRLHDLGRILDRAPPLLGDHRHHRPGGSGGHFHPQVRHSRRPEW